MRSYRTIPALLACCLFLLFSSSIAVAENNFPLNARRILFLGDSITHAGHYVTMIETQLRLQGLDPLPEIINIGLSSETCSGLSEPDHPFPRPDVHTRLDSALEKVKPDVVVACYGMNDGIYYPFGEDRFKAYQDGVNKLVKKAEAIGARVILMTPPPFDPVPIRKKGNLKPLGEEKYAYFAMYEGYDDVLARYAKWIMQQKERVAMVIDLHTPISNYVAAKRKKDPKFTVSPDGIHPNLEGHKILADTILRAWDVVSFSEPSDELRKLMTQRGQLLHDAWLTHVGHERPGVKAGLPLKEAVQQNKELESQIDDLVSEAREPKTSHRQSTGGMIYQIHYPASLHPDELRLSVDYYVWIPENVVFLRGVIVHQHGCGVGACTGGQTAADDLHWQALARKWNCVLMGSSYEPRENINCRLWCDPRNGSDKRFQQGLTDLAKASDRQELSTLPWCLWGHSGGGFWSSLMQTIHPERIVAIWFRSGTAFGYWTSGETVAPEIPAAAYQIPMMGNPGFKEKEHERFHRAWDGLTAMRDAYRKQGAPFFEFAPDPRTAHECGDSRYLAIPFFDFWLKHRLSDVGNSSNNLKATAKALDAWKKDMAGKHQEYVESGTVEDDTPPPAPTNITTKRNDDGTITLKWDAEADFESGIRAFIIERDGKRLAQYPENPKGRFGRPLFQSMSYHDTPEKPLPKMTFTDPTVSNDATPSYQVRTINSVGLISEPTTAK